VLIYLQTANNSAIVFHILPIIAALSELRKVLFLAPSVCIVLFVYEMYREPLNEFAPNSHAKRVWSLARTSLKVKGQRSRSPGTKTAFFGHFGGLRAVYVWLNIFSV